MQKLLGNATNGLVEGFRLRKADILLEHTRNSFWGRLIRIGTGNYWNHTLMVYDVEDTPEGYQKILVVDPRMSEINIRNLTEYFKGLDNYDVGVKRLEEEWFQNDGEAGNLRYRAAVASMAINETGTRNDSRAASRTLHKIIREFIIAYRFLLQKITPPKSGRKHARLVRRPLSTDVYSCSGFIQWSYYNGVAQIIAQSNPDILKLQAVIFDPRLGVEAADYDLLSITPASLAKTDKLSWKYIIKNRVIWEVSSEEDVNSVLKPGKN